MVISATEDASEEWRARQQELAELSLNSRHQFVEGANHFSLMTDADHPTVIVEVVRDMVRELIASE